MQPKHIPMRSCSVCREQLPKRELMRLVVTQSGLMLDPSGRLAGRGAYLCHKTDCWHRAYKSEVLAKALRFELTDQDRSVLLEYATNRDKQ
ncbi:MAG: YlxR family protein [Phototrophicaceae bacterium]